MAEAQSGKLNDLPSLPPDELCTVIKVEFASEPKRKEVPNPAAWLFD